jgi:hypothetical protein
MSSEFEIITICGSMRYFDAMLKCAKALTEGGAIVLMPFSVNPETPQMKAMLDQMHRAKIFSSHAIMVVGEHRGESTTNEIAYAESLGRDVLEWKA